MTLTALGQQGGYCVYLMDWQSPKNENDVLQCIVKERRTAVNPSCIANKAADITTSLEAGPAAPGGATFCAGFDNLGVGFPGDGVNLLLGEFSASPILQGVVVFPTAGLATVLPIISSP